MFSTRLPWGNPPNRLTRTLERFRSERRRVIDLTTSNPTAVGFVYPFEAMREALSSAAECGYDPEPLGMRSAREALATALSSEEDHVEPDTLLLTASTSEAYSFLFKLLADPGDEIVTGRPAYPLLEHIAALESLQLRHYNLSLQSRVEGEGRRRSRWSFEVSELAAAVNDRTRAVIVVHPNNPTGNYLSRGEQEALLTFSEQRQLAVISDEVFHDFALSPRPDRADTLGRANQGLTFALGGLSKSAALPQWKLGWIRVAGAPDLVKSALARLELIADSFLSVGAPVQLALPALLEGRALLRAQIEERCLMNLRTLRAALDDFAAIELLEPEGGWSVVLRIPRLRSDEEVVLDLLENHGVLVQPGYFYDFEGDGFLVLSLLPVVETFARGAKALVNFFEGQFSS